MSFFLDISNAVPDTNGTKVYEHVQLSFFITRGDPKIVVGLTRLIPYFIRQTRANLIHVYPVCHFIPFSECKPGFYGINCSRACLFPYFGEGCQQECVCSKEECDKSIGCQGK